MTLWESLFREDGRLAGTLGDAKKTVRIESLETGSCLDQKIDAFRGRNVAIDVQDQLTAALALIELDGVAERIVIIPRGIVREHLPHVVRTAGIDAWVGDADGSRQIGKLAVHSEARPQPAPAAVTRSRYGDTEWVLLTSGTSGAPKLVRHSLASLRNFVEGTDSRTTWSTFYDIRRYGGLQILLRALCGGSLVVPSQDESIGAFLRRAAAEGVTHISGTPSHWRTVLMSGATGEFAPRYVRLSGEISDQGVLDGLRAAFPGAVVAHAFASTEAGVGFEVEDGLAGFPASFVGKGSHGVEIDVSRGTLRLRSSGNAGGYLGELEPLKDADGFVNTGDRLDLRDGRYHFMGRSGGIINVGGQKVHPEEVEALINSHPAVRMSLVKARRNPITGSIVCADVVLVQSVARDDEAGTQQDIRQEILTICRSRLAAHKVPAMIHFVPSLAVSPSGKLIRPNA